LTHDDNGVARAELESGLRVVTESLPHLRSVTVGAWVGSGSRDESEAIAGASHFLEHLLFKGSATRTAHDIADAIESVGGEMNAFTTHEQTVFYVRVPDDHVELAIDVLADVVWRPALRPDELESERQVILEELAMRDDTPDDLVHDVFARAMFPDHPLGREVVGTEPTIEAMTGEQIRTYHDAHYQPSNVVVAAAGNIEHDAIVDLVARHAPEAGSPRPSRPSNAYRPPETFARVERDTEQAHIVLGTRAPAQDDPDRYAIAVLNQAFGAGMSSRLFQSVREDRGLAYSVYSYRAAFSDNGYLAIYAGTTVDRAAETLDVVRDELDALLADGTLTEHELDAAKGHLKGSLALSLETSSARMRRLGRGELVDGEIPTLGEVARRIDAVTRDDVARTVDRVLRTTPRVLAVVGPLDDTILAAG
jgi:predicted Zn-dependent peptidase